MPFQPRRSEKTADASPPKRHNFPQCHGKERVAPLFCFVRKVKKQINIIKYNSNNNNNNNVQEQRRIERREEKKKKIYKNGVNDIERLCLGVSSTLSRGQYLCEKLRVSRGNSPFSIILFVDSCGNDIRDAKCWRSIFILLCVWAAQRRAGWKSATAVIRCIILYNNCLRAKKLMNLRYTRLKKEMLLYRDPEPNEREYYSHRPKGVCLRSSSSSGRLLCRHPGSRHTGKWMRWKCKIFKAWLWYEIHWGSFSNSFNCARSHFAAARWRMSRKFSFRK